MFNMLMQFMYERDLVQTLGCKCFFCYFVGKYNHFLFVGMDAFHIFCKCDELF